MNKYLSRLLQTIVILAIFLSWQGCSVLGYFGGRAVDSGKSDKEYTLTDEQLELIDRGNLIQVYSINGKIIKGYFQGWEKYSFDNTRSFLLIKNTTDGKVSKIPSEFIEKVQVISQEKNSKFIGLGMGVVIDLIIIISLLVAFG